MTVKEAQNTKVCKYQPFIGVYNVCEFIICQASLIRPGVHNILLTELPTDANFSEKNMASFFFPKKYLDNRQVIKQVAICLSKTTNK